MLGRNEMNRRINSYKAKELERKQTQSSLNRLSLNSSQFINQFDKTNNAPYDAITEDLMKFPQ